MKTLSSVILFVLSFATAFAQIEFEKGYIIDNEGRKIDCFIKNKDWSDNPAQVEYRLSESGETKVIDATSARAFGIGITTKYVSSTVKIDRSPDQVSKLTISPNPDFSEETLFLKVLIEGKATLYSYETGSIQRFFYNVDGSPIEPLIYKRYKEANTIKENSRFRQQLWNSLSCTSIDKRELENVKYNRTALVRVFSAYNSCSNVAFTQYRKAKRQVFNVSVRPRFGSSTLWAKNHMEGSFDFDWGSKAGFGLGVEGEVFLGTKKNKWSLLVEPTYQEFSGTTSTVDRGGLGSTAVGDVKYTSIELPLGVRHYFFLGPQTRLFVNASFLLDFSISDSKLDVTRPSGYQLSSLAVSSGNNFAFGAGVKYRAFGVELRYNTKRDIMKKYQAWESEHESISVVFGYSLLNRK